MRRFLSLGAAPSLCCLVVALFYCKPAQAYAWMIKHGYSKCGTCHTDPSGGETLNHMGRVQAAALLSWQDGGLTTPELARFAFGALPEPGPLRLGASYRHMLVYSAAKDGAPHDLSSFPMQLDVYGSARLGELFVLGGSFGVARGIEGSAHVRGAQLNRELGDGWIALSRSHFVGLWLGEQTLLRLGRMNLPFGVRVPEHVLWAREATRTDRESDQQHGLALAHSEGRLRFEVMAILGNFQSYPDRYRERGYSLAAEYLIDEHVALGISSLLTRTNEDRFTLAQRAVRQAHGLTGRVGLGSEWALLGELDVLDEAGRGAGYAGMAQVDYEPLRGLHVLGTFELLDQGRVHDAAGVPGSGEPRLGVWGSLAWFLFAHVDLRLDAVLRQSSPFAVQAQLHVFL
jgi:hypothetical protein